MSPAAATELQPARVLGTLQWELVVNKFHPRRQAERFSRSGAKYAHDSAYCVCERDGVRPAVEEGASQLLLRAGHNSVFLF